MNYFRKNFPEKNSESGVTLVFIIVAITVIAVLGVGLYTLTMTSAFNQVEAQKAAKAYYISESCVRIAASEYKAAAATNKNTTLVALHNKIFTMPNNQGSCTVEIYPYWFYQKTATTLTCSPTIPCDTITLYLAGAVPPADQDGPTAITLKDPNYTILGNLKKQSGEVYVFSSVTFGNFVAANGGTPATFNLSPSLTSSLIIAAGDEFYFGYNYTSTATLPNKNGDLILDIDSTDENDMSAKIFPPEKGMIFVSISSNIYYYVYDKRIYSTSNPHKVTLHNIQEITGKPYLWPVPISNVTSNPTPIYVGKSLGLSSTSTYGQ